MNLDFDRLHKIYIESGDVGLYHEKLRMLNEFIDGLPEDKKQKAIEYDIQIQKELIGLTPEQRLIKLSGMVQELLFDLTNAIIDIDACINGPIEANKLIDKVKNE